MNLIIYKRQKSDLRRVDFPKWNGLNKQPSIVCAECLDVVDSGVLKISESLDLEDLVTQLILGALIELVEVKVITLEIQSTRREFMFGLLNNKSDEYFVRILQEITTIKDPLTSKVYDAIMKLKPLNGDPIVSFGSVISLTFNRMVGVDFDGDYSHEFVKNTIKNISVSWEKRPRNAVVDFFSHKVFDYKLNQESISSLKEFELINYYERLNKSHLNFVNHTKSTIRRDVQLRASSRN